MTIASRQTQVPGFGWLLGMSAWLVLTLFGPGFAWIGFLAIGLISRRVAALVTGILIVIVSITLGIEVWGPLDDLVNSVAHLAGIVVALALNPGWLRTMWERRSRGQSLRGSDAAGAEQSGARAPRPAGSSRSSRSSRSKRSASRGARERDEKAAESEATRIAADLGAGSSDLLASETPAEPVDVQTATAEELQDLPGMNRTRARRVVKERTKQNGFSSLEDFGEAAGLQPHEIVRLRATATCSPRPRGERRFGRRVDL